MICPLEKMIEGNYTELIVGDIKRINSSSYPHHNFLDPDHRRLDGNTVS